MNQVEDFFRKLFSSSDWPPRWHCGKWTEFHGWLYIVSDLLIWSAYFAIPLIIIKYISKRKDAHFHKIYFLFAAFILACGSTHFLDAVAFWFPVYRLSALVRFITGIVSWVTVFSLIRMLPKAFSMRPPKDLEKEVERRTAIERELRKTNTQLLEAQNIARLGNWEWNISTNKLTWSDGLYALYGLQPSGENITYERFIKYIHPDDRTRVHSLIGKSLESKSFRNYYHRIVTPDGQIRIMQAKGELVLNGAGEIVKMFGTGQDVTEQKKAEQDLLTKTEELEAVNLELQKFAYVASHDLQEPLRKIITFTSLLDADLKESVASKDRAVYMDKIISSSLRMQKLIDDILHFSKLNAGEDISTPVDLNIVLQQVLTDMEVIVQKTASRIQADPLPQIEGNSSQIGQLFQNLLTNAIKFRRKGVVPEIYIKAALVDGGQLSKEDVSKLVRNFPEGAYVKERFCKIFVSDNGIGFDESYLDRIFVIFQRLHGRAAYEGTGIGLAICKKIVDNHRGLITAISKPGEGSTFIILLPLVQRIYG